MKINLLVVLILATLFDYIQILFPKVDSQPRSRTTLDQYTDSTNFIYNEIARNMVQVTGGSFMMGNKNYAVDENPVHPVYVSNFLISKYELTQRQWAAIMNYNPSKINSCPECPVDQASWHDVQEFIYKLNQLSKKNYRLPTEAEWEYAARGGNKSKGLKYSGHSSLGVVGWFMGNSENKAHPVGKKAPNELGLYDMSGNVYEWCEDWYGEYESKPARNPQGPGFGESRVVRSGGWDIKMIDCRPNSRSHCNPDLRVYVIGFRLASSFK